MDPLEQLDDLNNLSKYKTAGLIATKTVNEIIKHIKHGISINDLLNIGNNFVEIELKDGVNNGLCFPICVSLNNIAGHNITNDIIKNGDLVKIELGVHVDGFPANIVYSFIVGNAEDKCGQAMKACVEASRNIFKIMTPGTMNKEIAKVMESTAKKYNCNLPLCHEEGVIPGVLSFQMSQYVIDGHNDDDSEFVHRFILSRENDFSMREMELEENEVYAVDIVMSSGSGKLNVLNDSVIFKRNHEIKTQLKIKASKSVLGKFSKEKFPLCINQDPKTKLGLKECLDKKLIEKYPIVGDKKGEFVARIKFTVVVKETPILICGKSPDEELKKINS